MNTDHTRTPDRLIWLSLLTVMTVALVADQARANLHWAARAESAPAAVFDDRLSAEAWCRMNLDALSGDDAIGFGKGLYETSAVQRLLPSSAHAPGDRHPKSVHAAR
jgi:hypothetical protein